jgi:hypothetical protein
LVITLIMLAVTLVMAVAFLALARRERGSVTTTTDTTTARLAAETAIANAEAQLVAGMFSSFTNGGYPGAFNLRLLVSTNYINPLGFTPGSGNPTNVNYFDQSGNVLAPANFAQNVANLFFLPRAPVMISSNELVGRFYLDLNQNGQFDANGWITNVDMNNNVLLNPPVTGNPVLTFQQGDPEWVGVLEHPDALHSANNPFLSRYAFIALPVGNTLDINAIHNQANNTTLTVNDGYTRNQGVGSWELNFAAFLADLNTNIWSPVALPANLYYAYNEPTTFNSGVAFEDARALLTYRYGFNSLPSANFALNNFNSQVANTFPFDGIDAYSDGPLQTTLNTNADTIADNPALPWSGADNPNHFFSLSDLLDPTKSSISFTTRLRNAGSVPPAGGTTVPTYDRYTFYRLLDQLGTDSAPDEGKMNLNYSNAVVSYTNIITPAGLVSVVSSVGVIAGAETNLVPWTPLNFFHTAADQLLRLYSANWYNASYSSFTNTFAVTAPFSITNIPVWVSNRFVYTPAVNRLLQLAANLYDASTNNNNNLPHVFKPIFERDGAGNIFIVSYTNVTDVSGAGINQLAPPYDAPVISQYFSARFKPITDAKGLVNLYGVPWIIGAKKGLPAFYQFYMLNTAQVTRKVQVTRTTTDPATATYATNQMYVMGISNSLGVTFWNSYNTAYPRPLTVYASDVVSMSLTNAANTWSGTTNFVYGNTIPAWPGSQWIGSPPTATPNNPFAFLTLNWSFNLLNPSIYRFGSASFDPLDALSGANFEITTPALPPLPLFGLQTTNYLQAYILDGNNVVDYVQLRDPVSNGSLNQALADPDYSDQTQIYYQWSTNIYPSSPPTPYGVINQITVSSSPSHAPPAAQWLQTVPGMPAYNGDVATAEANFFNGFFNPSYQMPNDPMVYVNKQPAVQAGYTPTRTVFSSFLLQANDPLVHYLGSDLNSQYGSRAFWDARQPELNGVWTKVDSQKLPAAPTTPYGGRYQPWGQIKQMAGVDNMDTNGYNLAYKDPLVWGPDNWDFPTNAYPTVGWIGRVHRGTPWQTVDLKSTNILTFAKNVGAAFQNVGSNTWAVWTGDIQPDYFGHLYDAAISAPMQDRLLFDIFTTRFSDNAVRGTLPVNQTHLASWSALFSGLVVLTNNSPNPTSIARPTYLTTNINPVGVMDNTQTYTNWPAIAQLVNGPYGINATRSLTNLFPFQSFTHVGDILQTPALTELSPFLNRVDPKNLGLQPKYGISDELYEWLPQQIMGLVRLGEPRFVVYGYGQALRPAPGGTVLSGPFFQLVTNYSVVAESAVRAVIRVDGANTKTPHAVVESYNVLPPN